MTTESTESPPDGNLLDRWKKNRDRPAWVRRHRDELQQATGLDIPQSLREVDDWLTPARKGAVTRKLNENHESKD